MKRVFNIVIAALAICVTSSTLVAGQDKKIEQKIKIIKNESGLPAHFFI